MLLDICFGTRTAWKILFVFCEAPGKAISRKEIKELTGMGNKILDKSLAMLEKFDLIIIKKVGKANYYRLNLSSSFAEKIIEIVSLEKKELNGMNFAVLTIMREFIYGLTNINLENIKRVVLFGSYAKRTFTADSDIDVAVISSKKSIDDELMITELVDILKKRFEKTIQLHYFTEEEFMKNTKNELINEIKKDGIVLMQIK